MIRYLAILMSVLTGTEAFSQTKTDKYFEGVVEYEIKTESHIPGVSDNELRERMGAKLLLHFKNGSYMREYIDGAGYSLNKQYYIRDKNMMYVHNVMFSRDTVYTMDPAEQQFISYKISNGEPEKILGIECPSSIISAKYVSPYLADTATVTMIYFFSYDLPVNPDWSRDVYLWKDVIAGHKSIATKFIEDDPFVAKQTFTAIKVSWQRVPDSILKLDPKLVQVKMPK